MSAVPNRVYREQAVQRGSFDRVTGELFWSSPAVRAARSEAKRSVDAYALLQQSMARAEGVMALRPDMQALTARRRAQRIVNNARAASMLAAWLRSRPDAA